MPADMLALRRKLEHEVTAFDAREEAAAERNPRRYHNVHALGQYLQRLEKAFALPVTNGGGRGDTGRPA